MKTNIQSSSNLYSKQLRNIEELVERSVVSSCGVEGISVDFNRTEYITIPKQRDKKIYNSLSPKALLNRSL